MGDRQGDRARLTLLSASRINIIAAQHHHAQGEAKTDGCSTEEKGWKLSGLSAPAWMMPEMPGGGKLREAQQQPTTKSSFLAFDGKNNITFFAPHRTTLPISPFEWTRSTRGESRLVPVLYRSDDWLIRLVFSFEAWTRGKFRHRLGVIAI